MMDDVATPEEQGFIDGIKLMTEYSLASIDFCKELSKEEETKAGAEAGLNAMELAFNVILEHPEMMINGVGETRKTFFLRLMRSKNKESMHKLIEEAREKERRGE